MHFGDKSICFYNCSQAVHCYSEVLNDIISATDSNEYCAALFLDISKAFEAVDQAVLLQRLVNLGLSLNCSALKNYLSGRTQGVQDDDVFLAF